jgi:hypothetical protein
MTEDYRTGPEYLHLMDSARRERLIINARTWAILILTTFLMYFQQQITLSPKIFYPVWFNTFNLIPITLNSLAWLWWTQINFLGTKIRLNERRESEDPKIDSWQYFEEYQIEIRLLQKTRRTVNVVDLLVGIQMIVLAFGAFLYVTRGPAL